MRLRIGSTMIYARAPSLRVRRHPDALRVGQHVLVGYAKSGPPTAHAAECLRCNRSIVGAGAIGYFEHVPCGKDGRR